MFLESQELLHKMLFILITIRVHQFLFLFLSLPWSEVADVTYMLSILRDKQNTHLFQGGDEGLERPIDQG